MCAWCSVIILHSVLLCIWTLPHAQCSQDRHQIPHNPNQDNKLPEDYLLNELIKTLTVQVILMDMKYDKYTRYNLHHITYHLFLFTPHALCNQHLYNIMLQFKKYKAVTTLLQ